METQLTTTTLTIGEFSFPVIVKGYPCSDGSFELSMKVKVKLLKAYCRAKFGTAYGKISCTQELGNNGCAQVKLQRLTPEGRFEVVNTLRPLFTSQKNNPMSGFAVDSNGKLFDCGFEDLFIWHS